MNGRVSIDLCKPGPSSFLEPHQEKRLVDYLVEMSKIGCGVTKRKIPELVKEVLDKCELEGYIIPEHRKFADNKPSTTWVSLHL